MRIERDEEGQILVEAKLISASEAKEMQKELFQRIKVWISLNAKLIEEYKLEGQYFLVMKEKFNLMHQQVLDYINQESYNLNDLVNISRILRRIINYFNKIEFDSEFKEIITSIETNSISSHYWILWIIDAQKIIEDPEKALHPLGFAFENEYRRLAKIVRIYFPKLSGVLFTAKELTDGFVVIPSEFDELLNKKPFEKRIINPTSLVKEIIFTVSFEDVLIDLKNRIEEILSWELRKIGFEMKAIVEILNEKIYCRIKTERIVPDDPNVCENCKKKVDKLYHFTYGGDDEFLYKECYKYSSLSA